ncbi:MAG: hypothetical protein GY810_04740 [Aureispira sp.]|nr:hypothetical protein [Aureispira sp.]
MNTFNRILAIGFMLSMFLLQACVVENEKDAETETPVNKDSTHLSKKLSSNEGDSLTLNYKDTVEVDGYELLITGITKTEFLATPVQADTAYSWLKGEACYAKGLAQKINVREQGQHDLSLKLKNGKTKKIELPKNNTNELLMGYSVIGYEEKRALFFLWEIEVEAGSAIMVNGHNGQVLDVFADANATSATPSFVSSENPNLIATYHAGDWTPSGCSVIDLSNKSIKTLFTLNTEGIIDLRWVNENTVVVEQVYYEEDTKEPNFKKISFTKIK